MKAARNFFVREPKFSVVIVLLAIVLLTTLLFLIDLESVAPFSQVIDPVEYPVSGIPLGEVFVLQ
jgi:hypothetical protein